MTDTTTTTSMTFEPATDTYRVRHDWQGDDPVSATVIRAVAIVTNTPPTDFDPLFESIDSDRLDRLFSGPSGDPPRDTGSVSFPFNDCTVQVNATGVIEITPAEDAEPITAPVPRSLRDR